MPQESKGTVLLWEGDLGWYEQLESSLEKEGISVQEAESAEDLFLKMKENTYLAILISSEQSTCQRRCPPGISGKNSYCQEEKAQNYLTLQKICHDSTVPVVLFTDTQEDEEELAALHAGVTDYISRERDMRIIIARLLKNIHIKNFPGQSNTAYPDIWEDLPAQNIRIGGRTVHLTSKEAQVMHILLCAEGRTVSREQILESAWNGRIPKCRRVVDTIIKQIRFKLEKTPYTIRSAYNVGYHISRNK